MTTVPCGATGGPDSGRICCPPSVAAGRAWRPSSRRWCPRCPPGPRPGDRHRAGFEDDPDPAWFALLDVHTSDELVLFFHLLLGGIEPPYDRHLYKERKKVEWFINLLKQYRRVATRYEKTARNFLGFVHVASIMILLR